MILLSKQCNIGCAKSTGTEDPGILGKDEVAGSNPAISSIEILQEIAGFRFVLAIIAGFKGFVLQIGDLICSLDWFCQTKCQFLRLRKRPKTPVPSAFSAICACQFRCQFEAINLCDGRGGVCSFFPTLHIMLQGHGGCCMSGCMLGLLDVLCRIVCYVPPTDSFESSHHQRPVQIPCSAPFAPLSSLPWSPQPCG